MKKYDLKDFVRGWFCGGIFEPTIIESTHFETAVKKYSKGEKESKHYHRFSTEITVIASGKVRMNDQIFVTDDIIEIEKAESTDFEALEDTITVVIKVPAILGDKFLDPTI